MGSILKRSLVSCKPSNKPSRPLNARGRDGGPVGPYSGKGIVRSDLLWCDVSHAMSSRSVLKSVSLFTATSYASAQQCRSRRSIGRSSTRDGAMIRTYLSAG
jgi:hypothetical protein